MLSLLLMAIKDITFRGILEGYEFSQEALKTTIPYSGDVTLSFCGEHTGEYLKAKADNGVLKGKATIYNANSQELFELHIENGKITGKYKQRENGHVRREGTLVDCKRKGKGSEYDLSVFLIYEGEYKDDKGYLIYEGEYDDDKPKDSDFDFLTKGVRYKCNYTETRGTVIRWRVDYPHYELEVDLKNKPIRFRYVDRDKSLLLRLYLSDNMMLEYENGEVVYKGDFIHDPLKEFRSPEMDDVAYAESLKQRRSIPEKETVPVTVSMKPLEGCLVVADPFKVIEDPKEKKRKEEEERKKAEEERKRKAEEEKKRKAEEEKKRKEEEERKKAEEEKKITEIVDKMKGIEDSNWKEITGPDKGYSIRIGPKSDDSTAGMYAIYHNETCLRIGTTKGGIMDGRELGFDDTGKLVYQTEYENGKKKRRWLIKDNRITAVIEYDNRATS